MFEKRLKYPNILGGQNFRRLFVYAAAFGMTGPFFAPAPVLATPFLVKSSSQVQTTAQKSAPDHLLLVHCCHAHQYQPYDNYCCHEQNYYYAPGAAVAGAVVGGAVAYGTYKGVKKATKKHHKKHQNKPKPRRQPRGRR